MADDRLPAPVEAEERAGPTPSRATATLLLIDASHEGVHVRAWLKGGGYGVLHARDAAEAEALLGRAEPALVLCDPCLPGHEPIGLLAGLLADPATAHLPLVVLRRDPAPSLAECYALGADAVLDHPVTRETLLALVRARLRRLAATQHHLLRDAHTGLANEAAFAEAFERSAYLAAREREPLSLALLGLEALATLRAAHGPGFGHQLIGHTGQLLAGALRRSDFVARLGADRLGILFPNTDGAGAARAMEKVFHRLQRTPLATPAGEPLVPVVWQGIAAVLPDDGLAEVMARAEGARTHPALPHWERELLPQVAPPSEPLVLLAEDDRLTASILRHRLEQAGYAVLHVSDGPAALEAAPQAGAALMLLDVKMPYMDGFEVLQRLRSIRKLRNLPVVLLTSLNNEEDVARGFDLGADDYVLKPFSPVELLARMRRLLRRSGAAVVPGEAEMDGAVTAGSVA